MPDSTAFVFGESGALLAVSTDATAVAKSAAKITITGERKEGIDEVRDGDLQVSDDRRSVHGGPLVLAPEARRG